MSAIISSSQRREKPSKLNRWVKLLLVLLGLSILGYVGWRIYAPQNISPTTQPEDLSPIPAKTICTAEQIAQSNARINDRNILELTPIVDVILKLPDYDFDPNCMYIIVRYDIMTANAENAKEHFKRLRRVYDKNIGYSKGFQPSTLTLADIDRAIVAIVSSNAQPQRQPNLDEIDQAGSDE